MSHLGNRENDMKPIMWVGILLVVFGALAVAYQGFNYTHQEKILDVGPIHATADEHDRVSIPPVLGGLALVGGIVLLAVGAKKSS
jgi:drug/metabolite transporter (DMT)-like permease